MQPADQRPQASESLERLLSLLQKALGHELPNQLIAVQGLARLLEAETEGLSDDGKEYLQRLGAAAQRSHEMIRALADFLRALRAVKPGTRVSVADVVRESAAELNVLYPGRTVIYNFPETGPYVLVPAVVVRQTVGHLLRNALQAGSPEGGVRIEVGARQTENVVELWVRDNGPGLSVEQQQKLFEPFACRDNALPGLGLGLVLARQLAENWGGAIGVRSETDQGTTISVKFDSAQIG
jgi:signal transduction histidine kinase